MLKFYVTVRPIRISNELLLPRDLFAHGFVGLDVSGNILAMDTSKDGRVLYEVTIGANSSYTSDELIEYQAVIMEALSSFGVHAKTVASALTLVNSISGATWSISEDGLSLISPPPRNI